MGALRTGYFLGASLERAFSGSPLTARLDLFFNRLTSPSLMYETGSSIPAYAAERDQVWGAALSAVVSLSEGWLVPYALAGLGWMHTRLQGAWLSADVEFTAEHSAAGLGVLAGVGIRVRVRGRTFFVESRYGQVMRGERGSPFIPLTVGVRW
jgi:opacity protein-like surface antigen